MEWVVNSFRGLFAAIDSAVYTLIAIVYEILLQISRVNMFENGTFENVARKFYTLLGIFMLFKVTFSFITYLVNPDQMTDKSKGAQKIIINILLVLAMIIITPTAFSKLYDAQTAILTDNVIPKLILGTEDGKIGNREYQMSDICSNPSYTDTDGDYISILVFRPFFQLQDSSDPDVVKAYCQDSEPMTVLKYLNQRAIGTSSVVSTWGFLGVAVGSIGTQEYIVDYKFFVSTIVGIVVLLLLVSFCFDVAVRSIKLGFLQIIAPLPIISYVDPKSGKEGMFKKWLKEVGKTWADLFIRLIALFFALYIIQLMNISSMFSGVDKYKFWVQLFIVIGALIFAKKLPKLIEDILGIKLGGDLTLNPMKKIRDNALGGKAIGDISKKALGSSVGLGAGLVGGMIAGGVAGNQVGATKRGMLLGAIGGAKEGIKKPKGAFTHSMREEFKNLTGNEMARLSLGKLMLKNSGDIAVKEVKDNLKIAYSNLNNKQTELNISEHTTASLAERLRSKGFDTSNIDTALNNVKRQQEQQFSKVNNIKANASRLSDAFVAAKREYQRIEESMKLGIVGANGQPIYSQAQLSAAKAKMEQFESQYSTAQAEVRQEEELLNGYRQAESELITYRTNKGNEAKLRDEISEIQKNIETMKSEKAQRERFYQVGKTPEKDYKKAVNTETTRQNK